MRLKNILICVTDIKASKCFYKELFGLSVIHDGESNVILTEGLVLQEKSIWESAINCEIIHKNNASELYFEENDMDAFIEKLMHDLGPDYGVRVVTADRLVQCSAVNSGILRMTPKEFEEELTAVGNEINELVRRYAEMKK